MSHQNTFLTYANMQIGIACSDPRMASALTRHYPNFLNSDQAPLDIEILVHIDGAHRTSPASDPRILYEAPVILFDSPGFEGNLDFSTGKAELSFSSRNPFQELDLFLRIAGSLWAVQRGGVQLHCAAIARNGQAYIFFGHSGSGKTTSARLSSDKLLLSDDLNILLPNSTGWQAYATPFWNPTQARPNNTNAPLSSIYRLVQAPQHQRKEMEPVRALAELISCIPVLKVIPQLLPEITNNLQQLIHTCPCFWLEFRKDAGFWEVIT